MSAPDVASFITSKNLSVERPKKDSPVSLSLSGTEIVKKPPLSVMVTLFPIKRLLQLDETARQRLYKYLGIYTILPPKR